MVRDPDNVGGEPNAITATSIRAYDGIRNLPADLAAISVFVLFTNLVVLAPGIRDTPVRVLVGLPFVLFVPGYAFIAALFPETSQTPSAPDDADDTASDAGSIGGIGESGIDGLERVALSFGLSIAVVPLIGLVLNFTPWGIRLLPILVSVSVFTLASTGVAAVRRWELPEEERFHVPYDQWLAASRDELFEPDTRADAALNVLLALSVVLAASSVGYAVLVPQQGERFSELYLLTETDEGDLVADDFPTEFTQGEPRELVVGVSNQEHRSTNYTLLVQLHNVSFANNESIVHRSDQLREYRLQLSHNETWHQPHSVAPTFTGTELRLTYLLFRGDPPASPSVDNAYREAHLWVNVTQSGSADS